MPSSDTIKNLTSSFAAVFIVGYGMWQIGQYIAGGIISPDAGLAILGPLIGGAATWLLNRESQTQAVRAQERAYSTGASTAATTTIANAENVDSGGPTTVNKK
jgi:hypothetical protein